MNHRTMLRRLQTAVVAAQPWAVGVAVSAACGTAWAGTQAASGSASEGAASAVGRVLGMMLFGYLALKWFNRSQDRDEREPRGLLGRPVKPWVVWLVVIGGLVLLMAKSG